MYNFIIKLQFIFRPTYWMMNYKYSKELIAYGGAWTPERFYQFALSPTLTVPGTFMAHSADRTSKDVADITAYFVSVAE